MELDAGITKEFLENSLNIPVDKFVIHKGSNLGDGNTSLLYSVDVWRRGETEPLPVLIKCFPTNPVRQQLLDEVGAFTVELGMYDKIIPELEKFKLAHGAPDIRLPFAPFLAGRLTPLDQRGGRLAKQLDNYLMMTDLRKAGGFRLPDRYQGLDLDHFKLVIEGQATMHAVSWAFKQIQRKKLAELSPSLSGEGLAAVFDNIFGKQPETVGKEMELFKDDPRIVDGLRYLQKVVLLAIKLYYNVPLQGSEQQFNKDNVVRNPGKVLHNEEPWEVLRHGDCWVNNLLFRYDQATGRPVEVIFIDLQICMEGDPFGDICSSLFCNTSADLRHKHLESVLHIYFDTFTEICKRFSVAALPGWSWEEFKRRFHRAQIGGVAWAAVMLPPTLQEASQVQDLEKIEIGKEGGATGGDDGMKELAKHLLHVNMDGKILKERLRGLFEDAVNAGVI